MRPARAKPGPAKEYPAPCRFRFPLCPFGLLPFACCLCLLPCPWAAIGLMLRTRTERPVVMSDIIYPRSPRETLCGWIHLPRYIDKIRLHLAGKLHADYRENLGKGFDER